MAWLKLCGVRVNLRRRGSSLLVGVLLITGISLVLVLFKAPQLDNRSGTSLGQWGALESGMHRNLKKIHAKELKRISEKQRVGEQYKLAIVEMNVTEHAAIPPTSLNDSSRNKRTEKTCDNWVSRAPKAPYFLTVVANVRIYEEDKAKLTSKELKSWLMYLRYIGVEHVYLYDAWLYQNESQLITVQPFMADGYMTYTDWHTHNPYNTKTTSVAAYQDCIDSHKDETKWQVAIDIDEYPFSPTDTAPGFLLRFVERFSEHNPSASEITMQNYLYLGKPLDKELMIERLLRRTPKPSNPLVKPIYQPRNVRAKIHHNHLLTGKSVTAPNRELRMNHYWGARLQNWGEDTPEILGKTEPDHSIQPIIDAFKDCESYVRPYLG